jgi:hypothetical protein
MGLAGLIPFYMGEAGLPHGPPPAGVKFGFGGGTHTAGVNPAFHVTPFDGFPPPKGGNLATN